MRHRVPPLCAPELRGVTWRRLSSLHSTTDVLPIRCFGVSIRELNDPGFGLPLRIRSVTGNRVRIVGNCGGSGQYPARDLRLVVYCQRGIQLSPAVVRVPNQRNITRRFGAPTDNCASAARYRGSEGSE